MSLVNVHLLFIDARSEHVCQEIDCVKSGFAKGLI